MKYQSIKSLKYYFTPLVCFGNLLSIAQTQSNTPIDVNFNSDGFLLKGKFYSAEGHGPFQTTLLMQGFPGDEDDVLGLCDKISDAGINAFTFNVRGTHKSEGEFSFRNTLQDIQSVIEYIHKGEIVKRFKIDTSNIVLGGYSFGGGISLVFAANQPEIKRIISIAGTDHGEITREYVRNNSFAEVLNDVLDSCKAPEGAVRFEGHTAMQELIEDIDYYDLRLCAPNLAQKEILLLGGWDDVNVTVDNQLLPLYRALKKENAQNVKFIVYQTDHSFSNVRNELAEDIIKWLKAKSVED